MSKKGCFFMKKRLVSLFMALMLIIGIFAVPAMAAQEDEGIEPYVLVSMCGSCNGTLYDTDSETWKEEGTVRIFCSKDLTHKHNHTKVWQFTGIRCRSCGQMTITKSDVLSDTCNISKV
jgi:hypothetical protein